MKKYLFLAFVGMLLASCSNDLTESSNSINESNKKEQVRNLLRQINAENPYSLVGTGHNEVVFGLLRETVSETRSNGTSPSPEEIVKQGFLQLVDSLMRVNDTSDYSLEEIEKEFDTMMYSISTNSTDSLLVTTPAFCDLDNISARYVGEIGNVIKTGQGVVDILTKLDSIQQDVKCNAQYVNQERVLPVLSVAANSSVFWDEVLEDIDDDATISLSDVASADIDAAGLTGGTHLFSKLLKLGSKWQYIVAVSAGASAWTAVKNTDWVSVWDKVKGWFSSYNEPTFY